MRFDEYMEEALYAPGLGYYERTDAVFGSKGDFVTAPGLGDLFARCLTRFCDTVAGQTGGEIAEYGPGDGSLARQLCRHAPARPYLLIERSKALRARQREALADCPQARWEETLSAGFTGVVIANELLDAQGARCFEGTEEGIAERCVDLREGQLAWQKMESEELSRAVSRVCRNPVPGYRSEIRPDAHREWLSEVSSSLRTGVVLVVDYGYERASYYHPQRSEGTLRMHARHEAIDDPFDSPGLCDISVDVDFTAVAESAQACGLSVLQFTTQAGFLLEHGLLEHASAGSDAERLALRAQVEMLTHPQRMGERFRVLVLGRGVDEDLLPHDICPDHRNRL